MLDPAHLARIPGPMFAACGYFLPRLMFLQSRYAPQVHWGDIALALDGFPCDDLDLSSEAFWDEWRIRWVGQALRYLELARVTSTVAGRARSQRAAAACYHWAEFMDFGDAARKHSLRVKIRECFQRSMEGSDLEMIAGELPAAGPGVPAVPYWLLLPAPGRRAPGKLPCVILSNGLDSMTEVEVLSLAESYLERGIAALLFDGPGQGLQVGQTALRIEMETVVSALVRRLQQDDRIAADRLAFLGISFGGYFALRVGQSLGASFRCVVNLSGGPALAPFGSLPRRLKDDFQFVMMGGDAADMQSRFDELAIDPSVPAGTDVLSIHGGLDDIFPVTGLEDLDRAWAGRHELRVHPGESHACLNLINACSLEAADWTAVRLLPAP
jgi:predicted esterase